MLISNVEWLLKVAAVASAKKDRNNKPKGTMHDQLIYQSATEPTGLVGWDEFVMIRSFRSLAIL